MSEVTKKSDTSSSQMRLLGGTPHMLYHTALKIRSGRYFYIHIVAKGFKFKYYV